MHFADDWEEHNERWGELYCNAKEGVLSETATHRKKFGALGDAYNNRWQDIANFGRCLTADESIIVGWYHSPMTIGP